MFELCLFDLDDTLLRTADLKEIREKGKYNNHKNYFTELSHAVGDIQPRLVYTLLTNLEKYRALYPQTKFGVFTRAPRSYASFMLHRAYPSFKWDIVLANEDLRPHKPYGLGIQIAMKRFGINDPSRVVMIGDTDADVRSAYNAGAYVAVDSRCWPMLRNWEHWQAVELVPDAMISDKEDPLAVLSTPNRMLPALERLLVEGDSIRERLRFDEIGHFIPRTVGGDQTKYPISVAGRFFSAYSSTSKRQEWHDLTKSIVDHKDASVFSKRWVQAIRGFLLSVRKWDHKVVPTEVQLTVVPHRPNRVPRLERLLHQVAKSLADQPLGGLHVTIHPELLAFKGGVRSQHGDRLNRAQRFVNVRDHLYVLQPATIRPNTTIVVIDDVTTTGASLIYASIYLREAGARSVRCLSLAKNVGDLY